MLPNNNPGYYVTTKDCNGKVRLLRFYETLKVLVRAEKYHDFYYGQKHLFSEDWDERVDYHWDRFFYDRPTLFNEEECGHNAYVVIDHNENIVPLCVLNQVTNEVFSRKYRRHWRWRRTAWGGWRVPRTTQEKRQYYAAMDEEEPIKIRGRRLPRHLADIYDDWHCHNDKCWKTQSKRRHQWKD